jgi:hypothetical protein
LSKYGEDMKEKASQKELESVIQKLELSAQQIIKTRGYTREVERVRVLEELIKEQLRNESAHTAARKTR